jgi:hypothetical protein
MEELAGMVDQAGMEALLVMEEHMEQVVLEEKVEVIHIKLVH